MNFPEEILKAVAEMGFISLTEVQEKAIPPMSEGHDVIAKAPTGTGKTCAFGIPTLMRIDKASDKTQSLILAPTRELAQQIADDLSDLCRFMPEVKTACVYGGQPIGTQITALKKGAQIVVATPGRLMDHVQRRTIRLADVQWVVLDEADEMLDMGFYKDVVKILEMVKNRKQLCMFSATISRPVMDISWLYQRDPVEIEVQPVNQSMPKIAQYSLLSPTGFEKLADVTDIVGGFDYRRVMVFCNTKYSTAMLAGQLQGMKLDADCLHGDMSQKERNEVMGDFREGKLRVLVTTDVAARGIDVEDVDCVINYDVPTSNEYYIHRIGRTARAGKEGASYILYSPEEEKRLREMIRLTRSNVLPMRFDGDRKLVAAE
jgi:ATP-dependent RNA helicase DeaD